MWFLPYFYFCFFKGTLLKYSHHPLDKWTGSNLLLLIEPMGIPVRITLNAKVYAFDGLWLVC